jgi:predicted nuclease with TOPRIM domain
MTDDLQQMIRSLIEEVRAGFSDLRAFRIETGERLTRIEKEIELINKRLAKFGDEISRTSGRVDVIEDRIEKPSGIQ